jgi:cysteine desulfurase
LRSGTLNVPAIVGFGKAAAIAGDEMVVEMSRTSSLRDTLENTLTSLIDDTKVNGDRNMRLPHNLNVTFRGVNAERLIMEMKDIAVSTGSACSSATAEPSHVLRAIGMNDRDILSSIRFGLGRFTTGEEIDYTINRVVQSVQVLRGKALQFAHS